MAEAAKKEKAPKKEKTPKKSWTKGLKSEFDKIIWTDKKNSRQTDSCRCWYHSCPGRDHFRSGQCGSGVR